MPSAGQDIYENDDSDTDGDGQSSEDIKHMGRNMTPMAYRSNEEVCCVLPHGEPTNASQMSTSIPPSLSQHPLSHPLLPAPTATYHPTATLPVSDQRLSSLTSPHTSTPNQNPTARPNNAPAESSDYALPTAPLSSASLNTLLSQPHATNPAGPQFYPSASNPAEEAAYHTLFAGFTSPGLSTAPSAPYLYPQSNPNTFRRTSTAPGPNPYPITAAPVPPLYHAHPLAHQARGPHTIFSAPHNLFGSLIAASASSATTAGTFDLEWHNQQRGAPQQAQAQAFASPTPVPPQQQQNGTHQPPGGKLGGPGVGGGEEARDTTMWLEYLTGVPSSAPAPPPANAVLRSDGRSLMHGGGEIDVDQGEAVSERESTDGLGGRWASWMMPLLGPGIEEEAEYPGGALSGAFGRQQLKELYSCYSAVTSLSSLRLYCRECEEHEECESRSCSLHSSSCSSSCSLCSSSCSSCSSCSSRSSSCSLHSSSCSSHSSSCSSHSSSCSLRSSSPFSHSTIFTLLLLHITSQALYARECSHPSTPLPLNPSIFIAADSLPSCIVEHCHPLLTSSLGG